MPGVTRLEARCLWYRNYSLVPADLECVLAYCDNPVSLPNSNGAKYNFTWDGALLTNLSQTIFYPCQDDHRLEGDTSSKSQAEGGLSVECGEEGEYLYPPTWPQCSSTVVCQDPGNTDLVLRTYKSGADLAYWSVLRYVCQDPRQWIKTAEASSSLSAALETRCEWRRTFPLDGTSLVCQIHHCRHPHDEPGSHQPPPADHQLSLVEREDWDVGFSEEISYRCHPNTHIESEEIDPSQTSVSVSCLAGVGEFNTPVRRGASWPNCTETVVCGQPPLPPVNGSRVWLSPGSELQETYNTNITYSCQDGSQFDTDGDGAGDSLSVTIRCQWNKQWAPHTSLPPCYVTHCVEPFNIPEETNLEEVSSAWTEINRNKEYQCKNNIAGVPTMFWTSDRSRSTWQLPCRPDGYFTWAEWPICLAGWSGLWCLNVST